jgi:hypothetical protein
LFFSNPRELTLAHSAFLAEFGGLDILPAMECVTVEKTTA